MVEVNPPQSWLKKKMALQFWLRWWFSKLWTTEERVRYFEKKTTQITFHYKKSMFLLEQLSDWCLYGIYVWQKFWRKNISYWVIIWIKSKVTWCPKQGIYKKQKLHSNPTNDPANTLEKMKDVMNLEAIKIRNVHRKIVKEKNKQ